MNWVDTSKFEIDAFTSAWMDEELEKSSIPSIRPHKYIRKYEKNGRTVYVYEEGTGERHRYSDEDAKEALLNIGHGLYEAQAGSEHIQDSSGFNSFDQSNWHGAVASGDLATLRRMLKKYKRQISGLHGDEEYHLLGLSDDHPDATVVPTLHDRFGSLVLAVRGRVSRKDFNHFLRAHQDLKVKGLVRFDGATKTWYVPKEKIREFVDEGHFEKFVNDLKDIDIPVESLPVVPVPEPKTTSASAEPTVDDVIAAIRDRHPIANTIAVKLDADGKFKFYSPYSPEFNNIFSNRSGRLSGITEYDPGTHARMTYDLDLVEEAIEKIKKDLPGWKVVTSGVKEARIDKDAEIAELQKPIPHVAEKLNPDFKLFPYQNEAVRFLEKTNGKALIGDEMGLGKTLQSLAYCAAHGKRVLVVVPKVVRRTWIQEAEKFFPSYFTGHGRELISSELRSSGMPDLTGVRIATVNYESLEKFLPAIKTAGFDTIIVDESHRMKSPKAKITKTLHSIKDLFRHRILLSGTAVKNKKEELHTQTEFIQPGLFSRDELKGGTIGGVWNKLRSTIYIARQKKNVLKDLPEKTTQISEVEVKGMPDFPRDIGEMSRAKADAALAKAPVTVDFVKEILDSSDSSVLLFTDSKEAAEKMAAELGETAILHHGQMSDDKREAAKAEFQREGTPKRVFVSTRQSLAVGATLTAADKVVFNDLPWTAADLRQAEDRAHRVGQKNNVNVYWITAKDNEWDSNISQILLRKYELNRKLNEGKQLSASEREWMDKPVTLEEVRAQISGQEVGPVESVQKAIFYIPFEHKVYVVTDILKSMGVRSHKYIRKYRRGGKWVYVYKEPQGHARVLSEEAVERLQALSEAGDHAAKKLLESVQEYRDEHLQSLRELADAGDEAAKKYLKTHLAIDREAERLEKKVLGPEVQVDKLDQTLSSASHESAMAGIRGAVKVMYDRWREHPGSSFEIKARKAGLSEEAIVAAIEDKGSIRAMLNELHEKMKILDQAHSGLPAPQFDAAKRAGGYGHMVYNDAVKRLESSGFLPENFSSHHNRNASNAAELAIPRAEDHERLLAEHRERVEREERERAERERREREERAERERREREERAERERRAAEEEARGVEEYLEKADEVSSYFSRTLTPTQRVALAKGIKKFFGARFSMASFDQHLNPDPFNKTVIKLNSSFLSNLMEAREKLHFDFMIRDRETGELVTTASRDVKRNEHGGIVWHNGIFVRPSNSLLQKYSGMSKGLYGGVESFLKELTSDFSDKAKKNSYIYMYAANSGFTNGFKGALLWSKHYYEFAHAHQCGEWANTYKRMINSAITKLPHLAEELRAVRDKLENFKYPYEFVKLSIPVTKQEAETFTGQAMDFDFRQVFNHKPTVDLGEIMLVQSGLSFDGINYFNGGTAGREHLNSLRQRYYAPSRQSSIPAEALRGINSRVVQEHIAVRWKPSGKNIVLTKARLRTMERWAKEDVREFYEKAPLTRTAKARVKEILDRIGG